MKKGKSNENLKFSNLRELISPWSSENQDALP